MSITTTERLLTRLFNGNYLIDQIRVSIFLIYLNLGLFISFSSADADNSNVKSGMPNIIPGKVFLESSNPHFDTQEWSLEPKLAKAIVRTAGDFTGDGKSDLLVAESGLTDLFVYSSNGTDKFQGSKWAVTFSGFTWKAVVTFDFDGDGCDDLAGPDEQVTEDWWLLISNCKDAFDARKFNVLKPNFSFDRAFVGDLTGKGLIGVIVPDAKEQGSFDWIIYSKQPGLYRSGADLWIFDVTAEMIATGWFTDGPTPRPLRIWQTLNHFWWRDDTSTFFVNFPFGHKWDNGVTGDFNGDGRSDLLSFGSGIMGWWIALAIGDTAIERPVNGLYRLESSHEKIVVGDFDGDMLDDIVGLESVNEKVRLGLSRFSEGLAGVDVSLSDNPSSVVVSNSQGDFKLIASGDGPHSLQINSTKYSFARNSVTLAAKRTNIRMIKFLALITPRDNSEVGAAVVPKGKQSQGPYVCLGYHPFNKAKWTSALGTVVCPDGYAFYSTADFSNKGKPNQIGISGSCCRLPFDDVLDNEHVHVDGACPDNFIGTGAWQPYVFFEKAKFMRCTKINLQRYQLGPKMPGVYWGFGYTRWSQDDPISKEEIPIAIRYGVGRAGYVMWETDGCIGQPPGSLVVEKAPKKCSDIHFRELQFAGLPGDPPKGTPVPMFPECKDIKNIYDPTSGCYARYR